MGEEEQWTCEVLNLTARLDIEEDKRRVALRIDDKLGVEMELEVLPTTIISEDEVGTIFDFGLHRSQTLI